MAATTIARRSSSSYLRNLCKTLNNKPNPTSIPTSSSSSSSPNLMFQNIRISPLRPRSSSTSKLRRDRSFMCSLLPFHTATASSRLISNLSSEMNSFEGRFVNYVSPI